jgi:diguanylate cyclase (GGDEF)-like protein
MTATSEMRITRLFAMLAASIFGGELLIMFVLDAVGINNKTLENFIDSTALVIIVFPIIYLFTFKTLLSSQERLEERIMERTREIQEANHALEQSVQRLNIHQQEMVLLGEMGNFFQACKDMEEAAVVAKVQLARLFPDISGSLFLMNASGNVLDQILAWGPETASKSQHAPGECWALRRNKPHVVREMNHSLVCQHMRPIDASWQICLPLTAHGEVFGSLCLNSVPASKDTADCANQTDEERMAFYITAAESLALSFANLRLRETLRYQALRDPLTGLFNRRYLLDTFERELERASARDHAVSIAMFDIDHFKSFNDTFGHAAGDAVLARLGVLVREWNEGEDIPVRFGGEEFTMIMPGASPEMAFERAETLRKKIESFAFEHLRQPLGQVTISLGIATYPLHGNDPETLIEAADQAMYRSKRNGRNRTTASDSISESLCA